MNTNSTPAGFPVWHDGVIIYEPADPKTKSDPKPKLLNPLETASLVPPSPSAIISQPDPPEPEPAPRLSATTSSIPGLKTPPERHTRKCAVCNHEDREAIEEAYLNWTYPEVIARQFSGVSYWSVYRHVDAVGLPALRRRHRLAALDLIIEQAGKIRATGGDVIRAIITSARIGDDGEYIEPVRRTEINHVITSEKPISNRKPKLLETP